MTKEIHSELSLLKMSLANRTTSLDQLHHLLAVATTSIPEEVRAKYIREEHRGELFSTGFTGFIGLFCSGL
jgi:hypothetical protein